MSGGEAIGRGRADAAIVVGREYAIPFDLTTGRVAVTPVGGSAPAPVSGATRPIELITPGAASNSFTINGLTPAFVVYGFFFQIPQNVVPGLYAHIYLGNVAPTAAVTVPLKRSESTVLPGGEYIMEYKNGLCALPPSTSTDSFIMILSLTQDVYGVAVGNAAFQGRATGLF